MRFTLAIPTSLYEAVYIPDNVGKFTQLKAILQNRGSCSDCIHLLKYAYTRSVYEKHIPALFTRSRFVSLHKAI